MNKQLALIITLVCLGVLALADGFSVTIYKMTSVTATTASTKLVEADSTRQYIIIQNTGSNNVIVKFGSAQTASEGITIVAGGNYEPIKGIQDSVYGMTGSSTSALTILEGR